MDTFQMIAFLLSVFNIASLMVSNVNNNNNNNNINDNEANVNDNNINESNTNAMVNSMAMVGLGGRKLSRRQRGTQAEGREEAEEGAQSTVWELLGLLLEAPLSPSIGCLEEQLCKIGLQAGERGGVSLIITEAVTLLLSKQLPGLGAPHSHSRRRLLAAGKAGRAGLPCSSLYTQCLAEERSFQSLASTFTWSPVAELPAVGRLLAWALAK